VANFFFARRGIRCLSRRRWAKTDVKRFGTTRRPDNLRPPSLPFGRVNGSPETAFDFWLQGSLHNLFDGIAGEPTPAKMLKLIADQQSA
jgi:hypothetical protein